MLEPATTALIARVQAIAARHYGGDVGRAAAVIFGCLAVQAPTLLDRTLDQIDAEGWPPAV